MAFPDGRQFPGDQWRNQFVQYSFSASFFVVVVLHIYSSSQGYLNMMFQTYFLPGLLTRQT